MNDNIEHIGARIKHRRLELGMTQEELALKVGYKSRTSINKIELSRTLPLKKVEIMANALETSPGYLMGWYDSKVEKQFNNLREIAEDYSSQLDYYSKDFGMIEAKINNHSKKAEQIAQIYSRLLKLNEQGLNILDGYLSMMEKTGDYTKKEDEK